LIQQQKQSLESLTNSRIARLATVDPEINQPYVVPVVFAFDGNNIFIPIDDKTKRVNSNQLKRVKIYKKIPIVISSLLSLECGTQIIRDLKKY
jgi:nitroimidazol reductase NimA-like FMN-containing flavoprotein (pyridoxamine 5'-phosphate oxidase superfamily)